jgi:hypothetical protein
VEWLRDFGQFLRLLLRDLTIVTFSVASTVATIVGWISSEFATYFIPAGLVITSLLSAFRVWRAEYRKSPLHRANAARFAEVVRQMGLLTDAEKFAVKHLAEHGAMLEVHVQDAVRQAGFQPIDFDALHAKTHLVLREGIGYKGIKQDLQPMVLAFFYNSPDTR